MNTEATRPGQAIERALDVALIVLKNGGSTVAADRTFRNVLRGFKQDGASAAWRLDFVAASGAADGRPMTVLRPVGPIGINLARASEAALLGERVARGEVEPAALASEIARVDAIVPDSRRWTMPAAVAVVAGAFAGMNGGDWRAAAVAVAAAGVGWSVRSRLLRRKLLIAPVNLLCAILSASLAAAGLRLGLSRSVPAALIASVVYMIPGLPLINGFADVISHRHLFIGLERIANAAYLLLLLAIAIAFAYAVVM